jgi:hypothetical protein
VSAQKRRHSAAFPNVGKSSLVQPASWGPSRVIVTDVAGNNPRNANDTELVVRRSVFASSSSIRRGFDAERKVGGAHGGVLRPSPLRIRAGPSGADFCRAPGLRRRARVVASEDLRVASFAMRTRLRGGGPLVALNKWDVRRDGRSRALRPPGLVKRLRQRPPVRGPARGEGRGATSRSSYAKGGVGSRIGASTPDSDPSELKSLCLCTDLMATGGGGAGRRPSGVAGFRISLRRPGVGVRPPRFAMQVKRSPAALSRRGPFTSRTAQREHYGLEGVPAA